MHTIEINASSSYEIFVESGILKKSGEIIKAIKPVKKAVIVTDDIV